MQNLGYSQDDISVMMNDAGDARGFAEDTGTKAAEGAGVGAGIGGTLGAIIAALTATGSVAAVVATGGAAAPLVAGPLAAALAGAGAGGLTGGIIGGLVGAGIPEHRASEYETGLSAGGILLGVHATDAQAPEVRRVLERDGAEDVQGPSDFRGNTATQTDFVDTAPADYRAASEVVPDTVNLGDAVRRQPVRHGPRRFPARRRSAFSSARSSCAPTRSGWRRARSVSTRTSSRR